MFVPPLVHRFILTWFNIAIISISIGGAAEPSEKKPDADSKDAKETKDGKESKDSKSKNRDDEKLIETTHQVTIDGRQISYQARAGTLALRDAEEKVTASIFYIAYTRSDITNLTQRPVTFSFNGGP